MQTLADLLRLFIQQLLRHLLPGKTQVALGGHQAQADGASLRQHQRTRVVVILPGVQVLFNRLVRQVAGRENVRKQRTAFPSHARALGQMDFDEAAVLSVQFAERVERLHHTRAFGPAAAHTSGQRHHGNPALPQRLHAGGAIAGIQPVPGIAEIAALYIVKARLGGQSILPESDPPGAQGGLNLLVLERVKAKSFQQRGEGLGGRAGGLRRLRQ
ncbi:hypothetical protein SBA3_620002 [Candidatus Sulfopaludibacter sp. SbA3]|nr:hypothetical protein SBA3_620002 [Candidatus Sulfopaludibacter sp. SbA3]